MGSEGVLLHDEEVAFLGKQVECLLLPFEFLDKEMLHQFQSELAPCHLHLESKQSWFMEPFCRSDCIDGDAALCECEDGSTVPYNEGECFARKHPDGPDDEEGCRELRCIEGAGLPIPQDAASVGDRESASVHTDMDGSCKHES
jgi:hypothetical protein